MTSRLSLAVATALGVGYVPLAPGTFGSLAGLAVYVAVRALGQPAAELAAILGVYLLGAVAATAAEAHFGHIDPGPVVIDEVLGMLVTLALLPVSITGALVTAWPSRRSSTATSTSQRVTGWSGVVNRWWYQPGERTPAP